MRTATATRRRYRIVAIRDLRAGDIFKISHRRIDHIEPHPRGVAVHYVGGGLGVFFGHERHGIYR